MGFVNGVKVDFVRHNYEWLYPVENIDGVRMASIRDISAMKVNAIAHSGQRQKDFYDIYTLLETLSANEIGDAYEAKYPNSNKLLGLRSLTYFDDIEWEREPALMIKPIDFAAVRERLRAAVVDPDRVFA